MQTDAEGAGRLSLGPGQKRLDNGRDPVGQGLHRAGAGPGDVGGDDDVGPRGQPQDRRNDA